MLHMRLESATHVHRMAVDILYTYEVVGAVRTGQHAQWTEGEMIIVGEYTTHGMPARFNRYMECCWQVNILSNLV